MFCGYGMLSFCFRHGIPSCSAIVSTYFLSVVKLDQVFICLNKDMPYKSMAVVFLIIPAFEFSRFCNAETAKNYS